MSKKPTGARVEVYEDRRGKFRYRKVARNGQITATPGEGYASRSNARRAAKSAFPLALLVSVFTLLLIVSAPALAQAVTPVTAASGVAFTSADHTSLNADGTPVITRYEIRFQPSTGCSPIPVVNLGKPTADAAGNITVKPIAAFGTLTANCNYTLTLAAVGSGGEGVSALSDPFARFVSRPPAGPAKPTVVP